MKKKNVYSMPHNYFDSPEILKRKTNGTVCLDPEVEIITHFCKTNESHTGFRLS
jgi:hypothetical protein